MPAVPWPMRTMLSNGGRTNGAARPCGWSGREERVEDRDWAWSMRSGAEAEAGAAEVRAGEEPGRWGGSTGTE